MSARSFAAKVAPAARVAAKATGLPVSLIIAHWGLETAWGTSKGARVRNNLAGITIPGAKSPDGIHPAYRVYPTVEAFAADYASLLNRRYGTVIRAAKAPGATVATVARALGLSPWAAHHYRAGASGDEAGGSHGVKGTEGNALMSVIHAYNLTAYDRSPQ